MLLAGEGLHASSRGVRVTFSGGEPSVVDGPFTETKQLIAGFTISRCVPASSWRAAPAAAGTS